MESKKLFSCQTRDEAVWPVLPLLAMSAMRWPGRSSSTVHHLHEDLAEVQVGGEENRKKALHGSFRQALEQIGSGNEIRDLASSVGCFGFWSFSGIAVLR